MKEAYTPHENWTVSGGRWGREREGEKEVKWPIGLTKGTREQTAESQPIGRNAE